MEAFRKVCKAFTPAYISLTTAQLTARAEEARAHLKDCDLCARNCRVDRTTTIRGAVCRTGRNLTVSTFGSHHGEEDCLRGTHGSGTIFLSWCNLRCDYCQNFDISWDGEGKETTDQELAAMMLSLQKTGCHNVNFVSPSHGVAQIIAAVALAAPLGFRLPIVYNTGGYDSPEALALLDGIVDIYMPDMKYGDSTIAKKYSHIRDYWEVNRAAVAEMHRQVGDLVMDEHGIAMRGLLVRHLVLPGNLASTEKVMEFLAAEVSANTFVNLMDQYHPCHRADRHPELARPITRCEFQSAFQMARHAGLSRFAHEYKMFEDSWLR